MRPLLLFYRFHQTLVGLGLILSLAAAHGQDVLDTMVVSAARVPQAPQDVPMVVNVFSSERLQNSPAMTVDETLREDPSFSLFRRTSSLIANPTSQGVSLRGVGPSGASRSLILLDGVPLNDPFGGWVTWSKIPELTMDRVEILRGGGSGTWGSAALGGTISLFTSQPDAAVGALTGEVGEYGTRDAELMAATPSGSGFLRADASIFHTDGFQVVDPTRRGPVDQPLDSDHRLFVADWWQPINSTTRLRVTGRLFSEERGNGTNLQRNDSEEAFLSAALQGTPVADFVWNATAYAQRESFSSFTTSVNADRTFETPAQDQFDVPATAAGLAGTATWFHSGRSFTTVGADARWVEGESRENYLYQAGDFTRQRRAGGEQWFAGTYVQDDRDLGQDWHATITARADYWENASGHRRETALAGGTVLRDDAYPDQNGWELSPRLGVVWQPGDWLHWRTSAYRAFRVPTLSEYYRPFRVGSVSTEANPDLQNETLDGLETGIDSTLGPVTFHATGFINDLHDAVSNVTLMSDPTGNSRQRQNLSLVRVRGLELGAEWLVLPSLTLRLDALLNDARVRSAPVQPGLEGRRLAGVPRHTLSVGVDWKAPLGILATARLRWVGQQYDDDLNQLSLDSATTLNLRLSRSWGKRVEVYAALENALDAEVQTSRSSTGLLTFDTPRLLRGGVRIDW